MADKKSTVALCLPGAPHLRRFSSQAAPGKNLGDSPPRVLDSFALDWNATLKQALEWGVLEKMPCSIRLVRVPRTDAAFHDFDDYERLLKAAQTIDPRSYLIALLGGEAGLRAGEIVALEWADVDIERRQIRVRHSDWCGELIAPKNRRIRFIAMTDAPSGTSTVRCASVLTPVAYVSSASRSSIVSRRRITRASPSRTSTAAGRATAL